MTEKMTEFRLIKVSGEALQRGEQYGEQAREEISLAIESYKHHFSHAKKLSWDHAKDAARMNISLIENKMPEQFLEMKGIAKSSGADFDDILVLNNRYEYLHFPAQGECTSFALLRSATADGHVYAGQNWDHRPFTMKHSLIIHTTMPDGNRNIGLTEAGQLLRNGLSTTGVSLCASSLRSSVDKAGTSLPASIFRKYLMSCSSSTEMRDKILSAERSVSVNFSVASADDKAFNIEAIPGNEAVLEPVDGILTHANHILSKPSLDISKDKRFRGERLFSLLAMKKGAITLDYLIECLRDHEGLPEAVCSHTSNEDSIHKLWQTNASIIYDLDDLKMWICAGPPCEGEYKVYQL